MSLKISKLGDIDVEKINIHDPYDFDENIVKIDLSIGKLEPIMIRLDELNVLNINESNIILDLRNKDNIRDFFNKLDETIVRILQERKITKKLKVKFSYRQLITTYTNKDYTFDIISFNVNLNDSEYKTDTYKSSNNKLSREEIFDTLKDNAHIQCILELVSINLDKKNGIIFIDNLVRQMKVKKIKPKRITNLEYSFIDTEKSDDENKEENKYKLKTDDDRLTNNILSPNEEKNDNNDADNNDNNDNNDENNENNDSFDSDIMNKLNNNTETSEDD
jgi:hypothetical protein